jgi:hypothetical protein
MNSGAVGPFWAAQTLGVALNSEVVLVGGQRRPLSRSAVMDAVSPPSLVFTAFHAYGGGTEGWPTAAGPGLPRTLRSLATTVMSAGVDY